MDLKVLQSKYPDFAKIIEGVEGWGNQYLATGDPTALSNFLQWNEELRLNTAPPEKTHPVWSAFLDTQTKDVLFKQCHANDPALQWTPPATDNLNRNYFKTFGRVGDDVVQSYAARQKSGCGHIFTSAAKIAGGCMATSAVVTTTTCTGAYVGGKVSPKGAQATYEGMAGGAVLGGAIGLVAVGTAMVRHARKKRNPLDRGQEGQPPEQGGGVTR